MKRCLFVLLVMAVAAGPARAHFIWIAPDGTNTARVVFSEDTTPDDIVPVTKIAQTKIYQRGNGRFPVQMVQNNASYVIKLRQAFTLGGVCVYGVLKKGDAAPFLLVYHPKAVLGERAEELRQQAKENWKKLGLQILLSNDLEAKGKLQGNVIWKGKPVAAEVVATVPGRKRIKTNTNDRGEFSIPLPADSGLIAIRARWIQKDTGKFQGKDYQEVRHYATLTIPAQAFAAVATSAVRAGKDDVGKEDPAATKLLKDARAARATWDAFPGFQADLTVNHNGKIIRGKITVQPSGKVDMKGFEASDMKTYVRQQIRSLVFHRLSNASGRDTPCAFMDKNAHHPLGRKIKVLNDELHSSYRVRDRQIIEVNRHMRGGVHFTITVMKNFKTKEKKFLPTSYVVNTWNAGNQLVSSVSHYNSWKRVGEFYLPKKVMIVTAASVSPATAKGSVFPSGADARNSPLDAWTISFSKQRLLKR